MNSINKENNQNQVGVLGATSLVGTCLLQTLASQRQKVVAYSRQENQPDLDHIEWRKLNDHVALNESGADSIALWVCLAPIFVLPEYFSLLEAHGVRRIVAVSSTSRYTKSDSSDLDEQHLALYLAEAETQVQLWAENRGIEWVILRPTLIYGLGRDKNISEIARFIRRFGMFPLFGKAAGLRQPIHAQDVASACFLALQNPASANCAYNISGAEVITYRDMVSNIFSTMGKRPHLLSIPLWIFRLAVSLLRCLPRYRKWSSAMAERMNLDMVFDHSEAERAFGFKPRGFKLTSDDIPT